MPAAAAPPEQPTIVPAAPSPSAEQVAAKAAQTTINVSSLPTGDIPAPPPKPGSALAKLFAQMQKKLGGEDTPSPAPGKKQPPLAHTTEKAAKEAASPAAAKTPPEAETEGAVAQPPTAPSPSSETPAATAAAPEPGKKVSPWKLVDQFKDRAAKAEARVLELEKLVQPEEQRKAAETNFQQMQSRMKEMEDDLRYLNSEKYDPDVKKAKQDYERTFQRAMSELKDVTVMDPQTQQPRALTVNDLAELAFMPLGQAQQVAKEAFGDLAPYIMDHRNEIRRMWDAQQAVLDDLKKNAGTRQEQRLQAAQQAEKQMREFIGQTFAKANEEAAQDEKHGHLFRPKEGDQEWNSRLEKGFKLYEEAFAKNIMDPSLSAQERQEIIRKHSAIRNRSAAYGPLRYENDQLRKQLDAALAELKSYKETEPPAGGRTPEPAPAKKRGMAGLMDELQKIAH